MRVIINDKPIPEGYTYTRCDDVYTRAEFIARAAPSRPVSISKKEAAKQRTEVEAWLDAHPKEIYTEDDWREWLWCKRGFKPRVGSIPGGRTKRYYEEGSSALWGVSETERYLED